MTAEVPAKTSAVKSGSITLARHGEPALSRKVMLTAQEYRDFWARYEVGGLRPGQAAPPMLAGFVEKSGVLVSSTRLRAIESAAIVAGARPVIQEPLLIEAPLPPPNWPWRMSPRLWGFFSRFCWWFFDHHHGEENRAQAEARADLAAGKLIDLAAGGEDVVVLAHGFFNVLIGRALVKRGWRMTLREGYKYWSTRRFERS